MTTRARSRAPRSRILWPSLRFVCFSDLDYGVVQYHADGLKLYAQWIEENVHGPLQYPLAQLLRQLAKKPNAIRELNKHRNRVPNGTRALNIVVHYLAKKELMEAKARATNERLHAKAAHQKARGVSDVWGVTDKQVQGYVRKHENEARARMEDLLKSCLRRPEPKNRLALLADLDADMKHRSRYPHLRARKKARANARRK